MVAVPLRAFNDTSVGGSMKLWRMATSPLPLFDNASAPNVEYKGQRIPWKEADRRPPSNPDEPYHTFFFSLDDQKTVIDAGVGGNAARWINHSCDPNCETEETDDGRVFIQAMRDIRPGEELNYDYSLTIEERLTPTLRKNYECRCGAKICRGTMLGLSKRQMPKTAKSSKSRRKPA